MKQRIAVRAIIRHNQNTLVLQRASGRQTILGQYELPGGRVKYDEQPDDAMRRYVQSDLNVSAQTIQLLDVVTYIDKDQRDMQYLIIVYLVSLKSSTQPIVHSENYSKFIWIKLSEIHQNDVTESTKLLLNILNKETAPSISVLTTNTAVENNTTNLVHAIIYSDGGSRGNPGPSAAGFVIMNAREEVIEDGGVYLGITTNNQAEYHGVRIGLERALELGIKTVDFRIDSMLVVNQMNGLYQIKNRDLWPINERIKTLVGEFDKVTFTHVKREFNRLADGMVNKTLDIHRDQLVVTQSKMK